MKFSSTSPSYCIFFWWSGLVGCLITTTGFAVDQSKFRTCESTSFCRRHRGQHSESLYQYQIDIDSVKFHLPPNKENKDNDIDINDPSGDDGDIVEQQPVEDEKKEGGESTGLWKSLQDRILGVDHSDDDSQNQKDPYVRGPPPTLTGILKNTAIDTSTGGKEYLDFSIHALSDGLIRMRITEVYKTGGKAANGHHSTKHDKARITYDELVLTVDNLETAEHARWIRPGEEYLVDLLGSKDEAKQYMGLQYGDHPAPNGDEKNGMLLLLRLDSFATHLYREADLKQGPIISMGDKKMTHFEIRRNKDSTTTDDPNSGDDNDDEEKPDNNMVIDEENKDVDQSEKEIVGYWEDGLAIYADGTREERKVDKNQVDRRQLSELELDREGLWEEKFQSHTDHKPHGPMSVGSDITFPGSKFLYGLPEHASSTVLKNTVGSNAEYEHPYRLYNLDVFEYDLDVPMALYGAVPLLVSQSVKTGTSGVFWFNPSETYIDINDDDSGSKTSHWMSESGIIDVFFIPGPTPKDFYRQYAKLTGTTPLPPIFSLGYHQCRWNYKDEQDVHQVHDKFEELDYPYDVLWLDIEHTDGKRYFTWDKNLFPNPKTMQEKLWSQGRRMVC